MVLLSLVFLKAFGKIDCYFSFFPFSFMLHAWILNDLRIKGPFVLLLAFEGQILRELPGWWTGRYFWSFPRSACSVLCHHIIFLFRTNYYGHIVCLLSIEHKALLTRALTSLTGCGSHSLHSECVSMRWYLVHLIRKLSHPLIPHS